MMYLLHDSVWSQIQALIRLLLIAESAGYEARQ